MLKYQSCETLEDMDASTEFSSIIDDNNCYWRDNWKLLTAREEMALQEFQEIENQLWEYCSLSIDVSADEITENQLQDISVVLSNAQCPPTDLNPSRNSFGHSFDHSLDHSFEIRDINQQNPPDSKLLTLFPALNIKQHSNAPELNHSDSFKDTEIMHLKNSIENLNLEITQLKQKNSDLEKLHQQHSLKEHDLSLKKIQFENYKNEEMQKITSARDKEFKILKREQALWEKQKKVKEILPTKKDRQEVEILKQQIKNISDSFKQKESRLLLTQDRFKRRVDELTSRNLELHEEVKILEQDRASYIEKLSFKTFQQTSLIKGSKNASSQTTQVYADNNNTQSIMKLEIPIESDPTVSAIQKEAYVALKDYEKKLKLGNLVKELWNPQESKYERFFKTCRLVWYQNGTVKIDHHHGEQMIYFLNGDKKHVKSDGSIIYSYHGPKILHTTFTDGLEIYEFDDGQIEKHYPDGTREIVFGDKTVKYIYGDKHEETFFSDGRIEQMDAKGNRTIEYPNGMKEIYSDGVKMRVSKDGVVKKVYTDGVQETIYADGKTVVKDALGNVIEESFGRQEF